MVIINLPTKEISENSQICFIIFHGKNQFIAPKQTLKYSSFNKMYLPTKHLTTVQVVRFLFYLEPSCSSLAICKLRDRKANNDDLTIQFISERYLFKKEFDVCQHAGHKWQGLISRVLQ